MNKLVADKVLDALGPARFTLTRSLAEIPIGGDEYRAIDHLVQEIDALAEVLTGDRTHFHLKSHGVLSGKA
ncbi:hypothetical protein [Microvirga pudoricolor]|uniref:hypothetical protein n=1 Tax=Microvirga pudoricolor TaxID=2778729 RepID=UPI00194FCBFD|nr:hypothetical protein [Microvirga pudoricolor]MBM6595576.1 hypothetical protein [Microvirga pudoricolor]